MYTEYTSLIQVLSTHHKPVDIEDEYDPEKSVEEDIERHLELECALIHGEVTRWM